MKVNSSVKQENNLDIIRKISHLEKSIDITPLYKEERYDMGYAYFGQFYDRLKVASLDKEDNKINLITFFNNLVENKIKFKIKSVNTDDRTLTVLMEYENKHFVTTIHFYNNNKLSLDNVTLSIYIEAPHEYIYSKFYDVIEKCAEESVVQENESVKMNMYIVAASATGLTLRQYTSKKYNKMQRMDLHYGENFVEKYDGLINRLKTDNTGLVLLHGKPGTGKTHLIRQIIMDLDKDKRCVVVPNSVFDQLNTPNMINLITSDEDSKPIVLILEDAEQLLMKRDDGGYSVANILNMTDGLMNDICNVQIIATFNTDKKSIDNALLRENRLIAKHEFDKLSVEDTNKLCEYLEIESTGHPMTLSEIYSIKNNTEVMENETIIDDKVIF